MLTHAEGISLRRRQHGAVASAEIWLERPDKGNALTAAMLERLAAMLDEVAADRRIRALVLRAAGRFFCTGGDITEWGALSPEAMGRDWIGRGNEVFSRLAALPQPVIAAINGHALGGGLELALVADLRVAVSTARLGCPEVTLGMIPGWMGTGRLAELIGPARARELLLLGTPVSADQALAWGLVTSVANDQAELEAQVDGLLDRLLANGPIAMALVKEIVGGTHRDMRAAHARAAARAASTADCREGVRAFAEKRRPVFTNE